MKQRAQRRRRLLHQAAAAALWCSSGCGEAPSFAPAVWTAPQTAQPIVAGSTDVPAHFAATGALLIATQTGTQALRTHLCSATLIAPQYIVTAAHCRVAPAVMGVWHNGAPLLPEPVEPEPGAPVVRGSRRAAQVQRVWYNFCLLDTVSPQTGVAQDNNPRCRPGVLFEVHPSYRLPAPWDTGLLQAYDVGVLQLSQPITDVAPALLLTPASPVGLSAQQTVSIAGYGSTVDHAATGPLAKASGIKRFAYSAIGQLNDTEMSVGEPPCPAHKSFGDSGGPTFIETPDGPRLAGVTSRLQGEADAALGTVDTRLDAVADWLADVAGLAEPDADDDL